MAAESRALVRDRDVYHTPPNTEPKPYSNAYHVNKEVDHDLTPKSRLWNPVWLHWRVLAAFALLYSCLIVAVLTLFLVSLRDQGLSTVKPVYRYTWTYGPTAVLVGITSLWWQIDFFTKSLAPWKKLATGPAAAKRTILLDYISPILPTSMFDAARHCDWPVFAASLGYLALKLAIIVSTGLLVLESTTVELSGAPISVVKKFDASSFNVSALGSPPLQIYYGIQAAGLDWPVGTSEDLVVPQFVSEPPVENALSYSATVDGLSADLECEHVTTVRNTSLIYLPWLSILSGFIPIDITTPSCNITGVLAGQGPSESDYVSRTEQYQGWWGNYTCNTGFSTDEAYEESIPEHFKDHRLVMTTSLVKWNSTGWVNRHVWLDNFTTIVCKPSYRVDKYDVNLPQGLDVSGEPVGATRIPHTETRLEGLKDADMAGAVKVVASAIGSLGEEGITPNDALDDSAFIRLPDNLFRLMQLMKGDSDLSAFLNSTVLMEYGSRAFKGVWTQTANSYLLQPSEDTIHGSISRSEGRLQAKALPTGVLLGIFLLMLFISLFLIRLSSRDVVSRDPTTLGAAATILAASPEIQSGIRGLSTLDEIHMTECLDGYSYRSHTASNGFRLHHLRPRKPIGYSDSQTSRFQSESRNQSHPSWWTPLAFRKWYIFSAISMPLAIVAVLQVIQHISDDSDGFMDIDNSRTSTDFIRFIPALVLAIIATLFTALQFGTALFTPFVEMRRQATSASRSLSVNLVHRTYPEALYWALKSRFITLTITVLAALVASFLTIVVSGLYFVVMVPKTGTFLLQRTDSFTVSSDTSDLGGGDNLAGALTNLIIYHNLSYPQWTYENLALPCVELSANESLVVENATTITVELPAIRPSLNCTVFQSQDLEYLQTMYEGPSQIIVEFQANMRNPCVRFSNSSAEVTVKPTVDAYVPSDGKEIYAGIQADLEWFRSSSEIDPPVITTTQGCPRFQFYFGQVSGHLLPGQNLSNPEVVLKADTTQDLRFFVCYERMEEVSTTVTFQMPGFKIDPRAPPVPIENTARLLHSPYYPGPDFVFSLTENLRKELEDTQSASDPTYFDPFVRALTTLGNSKVGYPPSELAGADGTAKLLEASNRLFGIYMAQAVNRNYRKVNLDSSKSRRADETLTGTLTYANRQRLKQDGGVKWALQAMLMFMALCAGAIYIVMDPREVLPHPPTSIAGTMSLLAGSGVVERVSESRKLGDGAPEFNNVKDDLKMWDGWMFSLGWWRDGKGRARYGVDVGMAGIEKDGVGDE